MTCNVLRFARISISSVCIAVLCSAEKEVAVAQDVAAPMRGLDDLALIDEHLWVQAVSGVRQSIASAPAPVQVLTNTDLSLSPTVNWADRLRFVSGVDVYQSRHSHFDVGLRGFNSINNQRVLITVDGVDFGFRETGAQYWTGYMHLSDISRVEIIKGPSSVTWGANAFGGVVAFSGGSAADGFGGQVHTQVGSDGERDFDATIRTPIPLKESWPAVDLKLSAGYTAAKDSDGVRGWTSNLRFERVGATGDDDLRTNRLQGVLGVSLPYEHRLEASYHHYHMREWAMVTPYTAAADEGHVEDHRFGLRLTGPWGELRHWHSHTNADWATEYNLYDIRADYY